MRITLEKENAHQVRQHQVMSKAKNALLSVSHKANLQKFAGYFVCGFCMSGIVPLFVAGWLIMAVEAFGVWVFIPVVAGLVAILKQVFRHYA